jgi:hypothetical protein
MHTYIYIYMVHSSKAAPAAAAYALIYIRRPDTLVAEGLIR